MWRSWKNCTVCFTVCFMRSTWWKKIMRIFSTFCSFRLFNMFKGIAWWSFSMVWGHGVTWTSGKPPANMVWVYAGQQRGNTRWPGCQENLGRMWCGCMQDISTGTRGGLDVRKTSGECGVGACRKLAREHEVAWKCLGKVRLYCAGLV